MVTRAPIALLLAAGLACNPDPSDQATQDVGYRPPGDSPQSGERGNITISEILWSGSVDADGTWDPDDIFVEFRNEGSFPTDLTRWRLVQTGVIERTYILPEMEPLEVGEHKFVAAKTSGCFPEPDGVIADLDLGHGDPFELTLRDADERLIEGAGDDKGPPFAGGWDTVRSRSMERVELMFGGDGSEGQVWHYYTRAAVDVPNNDSIHEDCRAGTLASPGRANSPDYSGAFATGSFD